MSYTNETTHFGIPLPLGTDLTTPMDYNEAAEAIDEAVWQAKGDAATANENAAAAVETAGTVAESVESLSATVVDHGNRITALAARMTNAENEIDDVRADGEDMITAYKEPTATSTHAYAIGDYFIYNDVLYKATSAIAVGATIVPNTNCSATNVATEIGDVKSDLTGKSNTVKSGTPLTLPYNNTSGYIAAATTVYCYINLPFMINGAYDVTVNTLNIQGIGDVTIDSNVEIINKESNGFTIVSGGHSGLSVGTIEQFASNFTITLN